MPSFLSRRALLRAGLVVPVFAGCPSGEAALTVRGTPVVTEHVVCFDNRADVPA